MLPLRVNRKVVATRAIPPRQLFILFIGVFVSHSFTMYAQPQSIIQKSNEVNIVTLQSGQDIVSTIPSSAPETIPAIVDSAPQSPANNTRNLNWLLKFSAVGKVFRDVSFANQQVGYIVTELGSVYKSTDGGDNWTSVLDLGFPYYWYGVEALSPDTVVISGFNNPLISEGVIRWTLDGGSTWSSDINLTIPVNGVGWLERVHFFNRDTGIVFNSFSGGCWYTTTGGKDSASWTYIIINPDQAWIAGNIDAQPSGQVYATGIHFANSTDFGANWISLPSADSVFDGGVDFLDSNNSYGWTGGGQISTPVAGWIRRTTDGGQTWSPRLTTFPYPIRAVRFFNEASGLAVGGNLFQEAGGIYSTTDSGMNWMLDVNTSAEMFSIESHTVSDDSMHIWCVGSIGGGTGFTGVLYKAETSNIATGIYNNNSETPGMFGLYQNYPNPFSSITKISFTIPYSCYTSLKVYNVFGTEVATLVSGIQKPGQKSIYFDAAWLASGVYYYRLQAGNYIETRHLLLLR